MKRLLFVLLFGCTLLDGMVYDCFLFFNELDLLEVRLNELNNFVDRFVIVESIETFQGKEKPLYFLENRHRFSKFSEKIIHIVLNERQKDVGSWDREHYQRDQIIQGLTQCRDHDVIIIGDVDEIVRGSLLPSVVAALTKKPYSLFGFIQKMRCFFLNSQYCPDSSCENDNLLWCGSAATSFATVRALSPQAIRDQRGSDQTIQNGGWHFSSLGGEEKVEYKLRSFSHESHHLWQRGVKSFSDLANHPEHFVVFPIQEYPDYPQCILNNLEHFQELGFIFTSFPSPACPVKTPSTIEQFIPLEVQEKWQYLSQK